MAEVDAKEEYFKKTYKQASSKVISPSPIHQEIEKVIDGLQKLKFLSHKVGVEKDNLFLEEYKDKARNLFPLVVKRWSF